MNEIESRASDGAIRSAPDSTGDAKLRATSSPAAVIGLGALAVLAVVLRFWELDHGLPHADEVRWALRAQRFAPLTCQSFDLTGLFFYPTLYGYAVGGAVVVTNALGLHPQEFSEAYVHAIVLARYVSAASGCIAAMVLGLGISRMYSIRAGIIAFALAALLPADIDHLRVYASVDALLMACFGLGVWCSYTLAREGTPAWAAAAGCAAGLAFSTKYPGIALLVPIGLASVEVGVRERDAGRALRLGLIAAAAAGVTILAACWPCVWRVDSMLDGMRRTAQALGDGGMFRIPESVGWYGHRFVYHLVAGFPFAFGWPLYLLVLYGVYVSVVRRTLADRIVWSAILPIAIVMGASNAWMLRYFLPVLPWLIGLGARAVDEGAHRRPGVAFSVFACVWLYTLLLAGSIAVAPDSVDGGQVSRWIADRFPGASIAMPRGSKSRVRLPGDLARDGLRPSVLPPSNWSRDRPDLVVLPVWHQTWIPRMGSESEKAELADLVGGRSGYVEVASFVPWHPDRRLYRWLDPGFLTRGFSVHVRKDLVGDEAAE